MTMTRYNKGRFAYEWLITPRRGHGAGRTDVSGRCSPEEARAARPRVRGMALQNCS